MNFDLTFSNETSAVLVLAVTFGMLGASVVLEELAASVPSKNVGKNQIKSSLSPSFLKTNSQEKVTLKV